jgi:hypothetical protein
MRTFALALLLLAACESSPAYTPESACYRTYTYQDCKSCGNHGGVSCTSCTTKTGCVPCSDTDGTICWWSPEGPPTPRKCVNVCPAGTE